MSLDRPFSKRNRYAGAAKKIAIREDAPEGLRFVVLQTARDLGWGPGALRATICSTLRKPPDLNNWSDPNVWAEVQNLMYGCDWYKVYDIIEALHAQFAERDEEMGDTDAEQFEDALNEFFVEEGIGWQLVKGQIITRGPEGFETVVTDATSALDASGRPTAAKHLHEALQDLSRRPDPDLPGAVYHAMGALECISRDLSGDEKATLGEILKHHPELLPSPLDKALSQIWGYASNVARHILEGRETNRPEAELIVGLSAALSTYLTSKQP